MNQTTSPCLRYLLNKCWLNVMAESISLMWVSNPQQGFVLWLHGTCLSKLQIMCNFLKRKCMLSFSSGIFLKEKAESAEQRSCKRRRVTFPWASVPFQMHYSSNFLLDSIVIFMEKREIIALFWLADLFGSQRRLSYLILTQLWQTAKTDVSFAFLFNSYINEMIGVFGGDWSGYFIRENARETSSSILFVCFLSQVVSILSCGSLRYYILEH